jgi:hypothetical protein
LVGTQIYPWRYSDLRRLLSHEMDS